MTPEEQAAEEQRAADYRASCVARRTFLAARSAALTAPAAPAQTVREGWAPLQRALVDQTTTCDEPIVDSAQLGQLTSGGPLPPPAPAAQRLRAEIGR